MVTAVCGEGDGALMLGYVLESKGLNPRLEVASFYIDVNK